MVAFGMDEAWIEMSLILAISADITQMND